MYFMDFKKLNNKLITHLNNIKTNVLEAMERYISVEPNPDNIHTLLLVLYVGNTPKQQVEIDLKDPQNTSDDTIRQMAKQHFENITDDIRVAWF